MQVSWLNGCLRLKPETQAEHGACQNLGEFFSGLGYPSADDGRVAYALRKRVDNEARLGEARDIEPVASLPQVHNLAKDGG